jgi:hypothetical protein
MEKPKKARKRTKKDGRLHIRLEGMLKVAIEDYAVRHGTSPGALAESHFRELIAVERRAEEEVEQI